MENTQRQKDIIEAAINIIARRGYRELTTKNLAKEIGITDAALYKHFDSKHDLIVAILSHFERLSNNVIEDVFSTNTDSIQKIKAFVLNRYELFNENRDLAKVMFSEELFRNDPRYVEHMQRIMHKHKEKIIQEIIEAQTCGFIKQDLEPIDLFRIIIGSMRLLVSQWNMSDHAFDLIEEGERLWNTIKKMIEVSA